LATITIQPMEAVRTSTGGPPYVLHLPEATGQTFLVGAVLIKTAGGEVQEAAASHPISIVGVALEPGTNRTASSAANKIAVAAAIPSNVFLANIDPGQVTSNADVGNAYGIEKSGVHWVIDKSGGTGNRRAIIQELYQADVVGDVQGRVLFTFHPLAGGFAYVS
jgi:hypothetical protein